MRLWAHLLIGQFKRKLLNYWLNYDNRWKALLLMNRLTSIVNPWPPIGNRWSPKQFFSIHLRATVGRHTLTPHLFWPRSAFPRFPDLVLVSTDSEWAGLPSWKVAWSYVANPSSYSRSKLINFSVEFSDAHQMEIHTEMKLLKTYLVTQPTVGEFGLFGG